MYFVLLVVAMWRTASWAHSHHPAPHAHDSTPAPSSSQNDFQGYLRPVDHSSPCFPQGAHSSPCFPQGDHSSPCFPQGDHSSPCFPQGARPHSTSAPHFYLETKHSWDETGHVNHLLLRRPGGWLSSSTPTTFNFTSQRSVAVCSTQVNMSYTGQVALMGTWVSGPARPLPPHHQHPPRRLQLVLNTTRGKNEGLALVWDLRDQSVLLASSEGTVTLTSGPQAGHGDASSNGGRNFGSEHGDGGHNCDDGGGSDNCGSGGRSEGASSSEGDGSHGSRWWHLCVQGGRSSPGSSVGDEDKVMKVVLGYQWAACTRESSYTTTLSGQGKGGEITHLLNLTTTHSPHQHYKSWRWELELMPLHVILETEVTTRTEESGQNTQVVAELRNTATGARAKFLSWEVGALRAEEPTYRGEADKVRSSPGGGECRLQDQTIKDEDVQDTPMASSSVRGTLATPEPEKETQTIRQELVSEILNLKSNMTVHATPTGGYIVRIRQAAHTPLCPPLGWSLNQIFNLSRDLSGWEYVVSQWGWGNMVVRAEFGASPLHWYQKTFAFSLDQAAPLPTTHLLLDFRDSCKFLMKVRWPTLASALTTSLTLMDDHYTLQVKEVDEFRGEAGGEVLVWVRGDVTREGEVEVTWSLHTQRISAGLAAVAALLTQAVSHPGMCGGDPGHQYTFRQVVQRLLGQDPAHLWDQLLLQGRGLLHGLGRVTELHHLWQALEEELGLAKSKSSLNDHNEEAIQRPPWAFLWALGESLGVLKARTEGAGVVVFTGRLREASRVAMKVWEEVMGARDEACGGPVHVSVLAEELASLLKRSSLNN